MKTLRLVLALFSLALGACATDPSEVVIVVDGEFATPDEIDKLEIKISAPDGTFVTSTADFTAGTPGFPRTLGLLRGRGADGNYTVDVVARKGAQQVIRRTARFHFTAEEVRMLRIDLLRDCLGKVCVDDSRTCGEGGLCERIDTTTDPWTGAPSTQFDAGMSTGPILVGP